MTRISQFIRFLRKDKGMSQQEIANRLGQILLFLYP